MTAGEQGFLYGFDASQITLTLFGATMQDAFFDAIVANGTFLFYMTTICGLIGMTFLFLNMKKIGGVGVLAWCVLMVFMVARPTYNDQDSVFFTNLHKDPILKRVVPFGGSLTVDEHTALLERSGDADDPNALRFQDVVRGFLYGGEDDEGNAQAGIFNPSGLAGADATGRATGIHVISLHLYLIHYLNVLNYAINKELVPYGKRMASAQQNFIDAIKMARTADPNAPYFMGEFAVACQASGVAQDAAYRTFSDVLKRNPKAMEKLADKTINVQDALNLYHLYNSYQASQPADRKTSVLPPLVKKVECSRGFLLSGLGGDDGCAEVRKALKPIMYDASKPWEGHTTPASVSEKANELNLSLLKINEAAPDALKNITVTLAVPMGMNEIAKQVAGPVAWAKFQNQYNSAVGDAMEGFITWGPMGASYQLSSWVAKKFGYEPPDPSKVYAEVAARTQDWTHGYVTGRDPKSGLSGAYNAELAEAFRNMEAGVSVTGIPGRKEYVMTAQNCADLHIVKSARQEVAAIIQTQAVKDVAKALLVHKDDAQSWEGLDDNGRLIAATQQEHAARQIACRTGGAPRHATSGLINTTPVALLKATKEQLGNIVSNAVGYDRRCLEQAAEIHNRTVQALNQNVWAEVDAVMANATDPQYIGALRQNIAKAGSFIAPVAIWFKGLVGGFTSGTYAEIMPSIVSLGIAVALMFAPLIMMLGLLLPQYALNSMLLPIMLIGYLGMVRVTFSLIHLFAGIMQGGANNNAYELDGETISMVDIALGNAYGAAFILTGALLVMLKNPGAIVQKFAGSADKAASVSFQEIMAAGGALALAKKTVGVAATVASGGAAAAVGKTVGAFTSGNMLRNQMTGLKSGYLSGAKQAQQYESGAAEFDALTDDADESIGQQFRKGEQLKGMGAGEDLRDKLNPEIQAEKSKQFHRSLRDRAASQNGLKKLTRGTRRTLTKVDPETGKEYTEHEDLDPFLDDLEDAIAAGLLARDPVKYSNGQGAGLDRLKADASKHITAAIKKGVINKGNTGGHVTPGGKSNPKVVNALAAKIEADILKVQPHQRPDPKPESNDPEQ